MPSNRPPQKVVQRTDWLLPDLRNKMGNTIRTGIFRKRAKRVFEARDRAESSAAVKFISVSKSVTSNARISFDVILQMFPAERDNHRIRHLKNKQRICRQNPKHKYEANCAASYRGYN